MRNECCVHFSVRHRVSFFLCVSWLCIRVVWIFQYLRFKIDFLLGRSNFSENWIALLCIQSFYPPEICTVGRKRCQNCKRRRHIEPERRGEGEGEARNGEGMRSNQSGGGRRPWEMNRAYWRATECGGALDGSRWEQTSKKQKSDEIIHHYVLVAHAKWNCLHAYCMHRIALLMHSTLE